MEPFVFIETEQDKYVIIENNTEFVSEFIVIYLGSDDKPNCPNVVEIYVNHNFDGFGCNNFIVFDDEKDILDLEFCGSRPILQDEMEIVLGLIKSASLESES